MANQFDGLFGKTVATPATPGVATKTKSTNQFDGLFHPAPLGPSIPTPPVVTPPPQKGPVKNFFDTLLSGTKNVVNVVKEIIHPPTPGSSQDQSLINKTVQAQKKTGPMVFKIGEGLPEDPHFDFTSSEARLTALKSDLDKTKVVKTNPVSVQNYNKKVDAFNLELNNYQTNLGKHNMSSQNAKASFQKQLEVAAADSTAMKPNFADHVNSALRLIPLGVAELTQTGIDFFGGPSTAEPSTMGPLARFLLGDEKIYSGQAQAVAAEDTLNKVGVKGKTATGLAVTGAAANIVLAILPLLAPAEIEAQGLANKFATNSARTVITPEEAAILSKTKFVSPSETSALTDPITNKLVDAAGNPISGNTLKNIQQKIVDRFQKLLQYASENGRTITIERAAEPESLSGKTAQAIGGKNQAPDLSIKVGGIPIKSEISEAIVPASKQELANIPKISTIPDGVQPPVSNQFSGLFDKPAIPAANVIQPTVQVEAPSSTVGTEPVQQVPSAQIPHPIAPGTATDANKNQKIEPYSPAKKGILNLYHETDPKTAISLATEGQDKTGLNLASTPGLALGQKGKGVIIEFDAAPFNTRTIKKPGAGFFGAQEFEVISGPNGTSAVKSLTLKPGVSYPASFERRLINNQFVKSELADGSVKYTKKQNSTENKPQIKTKTPIYADNKELATKYPIQKPETTRIYTSNRELKMGQFVDTNLNLHTTRGNASEPKYVADIPSAESEKFLAPTDKSRTAQGEFKLTSDIPDKYIVHGKQGAIKQSSSEKPPAEPNKPEPGNSEKPKKKPFQSRVYERLAEEHPDILKDDPTYNPIKLKEQAEQAVELIKTDLQKAYRIAVGAEVSTEITQTAVSIALAEKALVDGNFTLFNTLTKNRSFAQTRRGQEIVSEKGSVTDNSVAKYVKELINTRMENLGRNYLGDLKDTVMGKKTPAKQRVLDKIKSEVKVAKRAISGNKLLDLKEAQKLIDSLACK